MEPPKIPDLLYTTLPISPTIKTAYTFDTLRPGTSNTSTSTSSTSTPPNPPIWLIFINGLGLPQSFWQPTLTHLKPLIPADFPVPIYTTTYDRQYQGLSQPHSPTSAGPHPPAPVHPFESTTDELSALVTHLRTQQTQHLQNATTILISHSIGVPLARLYITSTSTSTSKHTTTTINTHAISALIALDSNPASIDLPTLFPDPTSPTFDPSTLPSDTTLESLQTSIQNYTRFFSPSAPNAEGLDRSTLSALLPQPNAPVLPLAPPGIVRVLAHDPETFEQEGLKICTVGLTRGYVQPAWDGYNRGLLELDGKGTGEVKVVEGAGHFVQRDRPDVVAGAVWGVIGEVLEGRGEGEVK